MKKVLGILLALVLVLAFSVPVMAVEEPVTTAANVVGTGGSPPEIKCKWETAFDFPSGDDDTTTPGMQADLAGPQADKTIYYWAVVMDPQGVDNIQKVWADVYEPCGTFKYEVDLEQIYCLEPASAVWALDLAEKAGLVVYGGVHTFATTSQQLLDGQAKMYKSSADLTHEQQGGYYRVEAYAQDAQANVSLMLENCFEYVRTPCIELDFAGVNFGDVLVCNEKIVSGDDQLDTPELPTIKNSGNCDLDISVHFDNMGFIAPTGEVEFDAQLNLFGKVSNILPSVWTPLPGKLVICTPTPMHFSIHVMKDTVKGAHSGTLTIKGVDSGTPCAGTPCLPCMP